MTSQAKASIKFQVSCSRSARAMLKPEPYFAKGKKGKMIDGDRIGYIPDMWIIEIADLEEFLRFVRSMENTQRYDFGGVVMSVAPEGSEIRGTITDYDDYRE